MSGSALPDVFGSGQSPIGNCFATIEHLTLIFGSEFLADYTTDLEADGTNDGVDLAIIEAHDQMMTYLSHRYTEDELRGVSWVYLREARIAGYYLALRRGQNVTTGIQQAYMDVMADLESMANDTRRIIPGVPTRHLPGPNISNYEIDNRFPSHRQRRIRSQSTSDHSPSLPSRNDHPIP